MSLRRIRRNLILGFLLGMAVLFALAVYGEAPRVAEALRGFDWRLIPLMLALTCANYGLRWVKWQFYLRILHIGPVTRPESALVFFSGLGMTMTPGKAGEWLKSVLLKQLCGTSLSHSAPIVLAERLSDGLAMLLLGSAGAVAFRLGWQVLAFMLAIAALAVGITQHRPLAARLLSMAEGLPGLSRHLARLKVFYESARTLLHWRSLGVAVGLGTVSWFCECVAFFLVLSGLGAEPTILLLLQATFILALATLVGSISMLPGGLGAAEGSIAVLLVNTVALSPDLAAAATLLIRLCTLWFGVTIGLVALGLMVKRIEVAVE